MALSFDAVFVATAIVATAVVSVVAGLAATVTVTVAAADVAAVVMFISSSSFCGSSSVDSMCRGETGRAITSSSLSGLDVQLNWDDVSGCLPIASGVSIGERAGLLCLGFFLGEQRGLPSLSSIGSRWNRPIAKYSW